MESEAKYVIVGAFVLIFTVLILVALLWLSEVSGSRSSKFYTIYFRLYSLEGLQKDSDVTMKGIKVGSVADYAISPRSVEEVKVTIRVDEDTPIKVDTRAALRRNLLTGLAWLDLVGTLQESAVLTQIPPGEEYPVIKEGRTELEKIAESIPEVLERANALVAKVSDLLSDDNRASFTQSLKNVELATGVLAENRETLSSILTNLDSAVVDMRATSASLRSFATQANSSLDEISEQTAASLKAIEQAALGIDKNTGQMTDDVRSLSAALAQEVAILSQSVTSAAGSFARAVEGFEDPRTIITGPRETLLGPGETLE